MGNCLRIKRGTESSSSSSIEWANDDIYSDDDDWVSPMKLATQSKHVSGKLLLDRGFPTPLSTNSTLKSYSDENHKEIKIKITKKQLEKLLGEVDVHELPVDKFLSRLINVSSNAANDDPNHYHNQYQRSWKPHLQSIPEVD